MKKTIGSPSKKLQLSSLPPVNTLHDVFPFSFSFDQDLKIIGIGRAIPKIIASIDTVNKLEDLLLITSEEHTTFEALKSKTQKLSIFRFKNSPIKLRGEYYFETSTKLLYFLGTPILNSPTDISQNNLTINDFAKYDVLPDYLLTLQAQRESNRRATEIADQLAVKSEKLKISNEELRRFAYVASHDLQSPLRSIVSFSQLLNRKYHETIDDQGKEYLQFIISSTKRMNALIHDLLSYSRVHNKHISFSTIDLNVVLDNVLQDLQVEIKKREVRIHYETLPNIVADPMQMQQLFQNLITNAIKFNTDPQPKIDISYKDQLGKHLFAFKDNGIGISPDFSKKIFEVFQRLHSNEEFEGTGIGLTICKKIIERHEGEIWVESESKKGSEFFFTISKKLQTNPS